MKAIIGVTGLTITKFNPNSPVTRKKARESLEFGQFILPYKTAQFQCASCGRKVYTRVPGFMEAVNRFGGVCEEGFKVFVECQHCKAFYFTVTNEEGKVFVSDHRLPSAAILAAKNYTRGKQ